MTTTYRLTVPPEGVGQRLDRFLADALPDLSRTRLQALIADGHVLVQGGAARPSLRLTAGNQIAVSIPLPQSSHLEPENRPLDVLYEDGDLLILNKPAGVVVHPAPGHARGTLVHALLAHIPDLAGIGGELRPGIVHRLDKDTSGVLAVAKNEQTLNVLTAQFRDRTAHKEYLALVTGHPTSEAGVIRAAIGRHPAQRQKMAVVPRGRAAVTAYRTLARLPGYALLSVEPQTGRTHQIRVHLAHIGYPVAGDPAYGPQRSVPGLTRQFLHAHRLTIHLPGRDAPTTFEAPLPPDLAAVLAGLRGS